MPELAHLHDSRFNDLVTEAHALVNHGLGLRTSGRDQITVIAPGNIELAKQAIDKGAVIGDPRVT